MPLRSAVLAAACAAAFLSLGSVAEAARPTVSLTIKGQADAGTPTPFTWTSTSVPSGTKLAIQRRQGTAGVWRTLVSLTSHSGASRLPSLALGRYKLRIANLGRHGKVLAERTRTLEVFGRVPFSTLFTDQSDESSPTSGDVSEPGTITTPTTTFDYVWKGGAEASAGAIIRVARSQTCRSIHIDFVPEYGSSAGSGVNVTLTLVQATLDPVGATAGYESLGSFDARLVPGTSWSINSQSNGTVDVFGNGYADCYSRARLLRPTG